MSSLPTAVLFKDLGVIRSKDGSYHYHASFAAFKAWRFCGMIFNNLAILDCRVEWRIYNTYVKPVLSYDSISLNPDSRFNIKTIEKV